MLDKLRSRARAIKSETHAIFLAARDPRTPWYARALILFVVAHTLSPIDLIPDFIPVIGYLDDLIITPVGLALAIRLIPPVVLQEARERVREGEPAAGSAWSRRAALAGAVFVGAIWVVILIWAVKSFSP